MPDTAAGLSLASGNRLQSQTNSFTAVSNWTPHQAAGAEWAEDTSSTHCALHNVCLMGN